MLWEVRSRAGGLSVVPVSMSESLGFGVAALASCQVEGLRRHGLQVEQHLLHFAASKPERC